MSLLEYSRDMQVGVDWIRGTRVWGTIEKWTPNYLKNLTPGLGSQDASPEAVPVARYPVVRSVVSQDRFFV